MFVRGSIIYLTIFALLRFVPHLSGMTILRSLVSTTKMASSFPGSVLLALWLTW
jgi:hypothetical protein